MATKSIWLSLVAVFFCVHGYRAKTEQTSKPNIVVIVADDLGWDDVSFHGSQQIPTPNIDALAFGGIILNNYYVSPICTPSRSALMTGRHPIHTGLQHSVIVGSEPYGLGLNETIMPQYFKQLGYATRMVGKWHLGFFAKEYTPLYRGFDSHFGYWLGAEDYFSHNAWATKDENGLDFRRDMEVYNDSGKYSTEEFTKEAVSVIKNHDTSKPLFLYLAHQAVHSANPGDPIQAPQKYIDRFGYIKNEHRRKFAGVVSALDDSIGNLTLALYDKGILNNTIIVFTTDNGGPAAGFDMNYASNWPLKGVKATIWEGGVRGVGFAWSQLFNPDARERVSKDMIHICDWLPTLYRAAGGDPTTLKNSDGMDVWDTLSKSKPSPRTEILHNIDPVVGQGAIRVGDMKLVVGVGPYHGDWDHWYAPEEYHAKKHHGKLNHYLDNEMKYEIIEGNKVPTGFKKLNPSLLKKLNGNPDLEDLKFLTPQSRWEVKPGEKVELKQHEQFPSKLYKSKLASLLGVKPPPNMGISPVVQCGPIPANASKSCELSKAPCLFNVALDPCEFHNIADEYPNMVKDMIRRLDNYKDTMVPVRNKGIDEHGNPKYHNGVWDPWVTL